jgi:hypothetical protein
MIETANLSKVQDKTKGAQAKKRSSFKNGLPIPRESWMNLDNEFHSEAA